MSPLSRVVLQNARVNLGTSPRICRPFTSSVLCLKRYAQSPRTKNQQRVRRDEYEQDDRDSYDNYGPNEPRFGLEPGKIVVGSIIAACTGVYIYGGFYLPQQARTNYTNETKKKIEQFRKNFTMSYEGIQNGRYYTILTSFFNHANFPHIVFNMLGLWGFGQHMVQLFGVPTFGYLIVGSTIVGGLAQYYYWQNTKHHGVAVGASGGILGVIAAQTLVMPRHSIILGFVPMPMWVAGAITVGASIAGLQGYWGSSLGHADHLGGMAFGALFWLVILRKRPGGWMPHYP